MEIDSPEAVVVPITPRRGKGHAAKRFKAPPAKVDADAHYSSDPDINLVPELEAIRRTHSFDRLREVLQVDAPIQYPPEIEVAFAKLTPKQRRFCQLYASGSTKRDAYLIAYKGLSNPVDPSAYDEHVVSYSVTMANPVTRALILNTVQLLLRWLDTRWLRDEGAATDYCMSSWYRISQDPASSESARLRSLEMIAKASGVFVQRVEVTHHQGIRAEDAYALLADAVGQMQLGPGSIEAVYETVSDQAPYAQLDTQPNIGSASCPRCGGSYIYPDTIGGDGDGI